MSEAANEGVEGALDAAASAAALALFVDFDGTLSEIVPRPEDARPVAGALEALAALADGGARVALVSGRALDDLDRRAPIPAAWLVGQHGAELRAPWGARERLAPVERTKPILDSFAACAHEVAAAHGVRVEEKGASVAVHWRGLEPVVVERALAALAPVVAVATVSGLVAAQHGKCVLELRARGVDKGRAVAALLDRWERPALGVAVGDDTTDEDMFREVAQRDGLAIKVGAGATVARHRVASPAELVRFFVALAERRATRPPR